MQPWSLCSTVLSVVWTAVHVHGAPCSNGTSPKVTWTQVGQTVSHSDVVAITMTTSPVNGLPLFAYGFEDPDRGTRVRVMDWDGEAWQIGFDRRSQFPQNYSEFDIKARGDNHYLALRIAGRYGSVLNSAANWAGSYAFHNGLIDYEIMENGDMVMFWHSLAPDGAGYPGTGGSLDLVTYKASGWTSYPATPAFGDKYSVGHDHGDSPITGARIVFRNAANGKDPTNLVMAFSQNGVITVLNTPKGIAHPAVIGSFPGDTVGLDSNDEGHVCVAYHRGGNAVQVSCLAPGSSEWKHLGAALSGSSPGQRLRPEVVVTKTKVFALGRSDSAENTILAASCLLESAGEEWAPASYPALGIVSYFQATGNSDTVFLAVAEGNGEGLRVVQTSG